MVQNLNNLELESKMILDLSEQTLDSDLRERIRIIIQKQAGAKRQVYIQMAIPHPVEQVWQLITDYDKLSKFIPNLTHYRQIDQTETSKHLELVGSCRILNFWFSMRLVLAAIEISPYHIDTQLIEGNLRSYSGQWRLEPDQNGSRY